MNIHKRRHVWGHLSLLGLLLAAQPAHSQQEPHVLYTLQSGDTLSALVGRYMSGPRALQDIVEYNHLTDPNKVLAGDQLKIPRHLLRHAPSVAKVSHINCNNILRLEPGTPTPVQTGDSLQEGAVVQVPSGCHLTVMLEDKSLLRTLSGAVVKFSTLRRNPFDALPEVRMELLSGRMQVNVKQKRQNGDAPFEVRTPTSIAGVRGTEFQVAFDDGKRSSQIEVSQGVVVAKGASDETEQMAAAGQGVLIQANGQSLPVEDRLPPPKYLASTPLGRTGRVLEFEAVAKSHEYIVRHSDDASFVFLQSTQSLPEPVLMVRNFSPRPQFQQWAAVSASGIHGLADNYAFCQAYLSKQAWRCNINFNTSGLGNPHVRLHKVESGGQLISIVDRDVKLGPKDQMVFRGLPSGRYKWQLEHDTEGAQRVNHDGEFEVVAIPAETS